MIVSAPAKSGDVPTVVHGANRAEGNPQIISCASCTTNCITPVIEVAHRRFGVERSVMTTVHAYTASQQVVDGPGPGLRLGSAACDVDAHRPPGHAGASLYEGSSGGVWSTFRGGGDASRPPAARCRARPVAAERASISALACSRVSPPSISSPKAWLMVDNH